MNGTKAAEVLAKMDLNMPSAEQRPHMLITGANGFIGSALCRAAVEAGYKVTGVYRPSFVGVAIPGVRRILGSLPYDLPPDLAAEVDVIAHCAAVTTAASETESRAVNVDGTAFLLALGKAAKRKARFVFLSSQSAVTANDSVYAVTKRLAEDLVRQSGLPYAIVRPGLVFGPGSAGLYGRMKKLALSFPVIPVPGNGRALVQPVHVDDLCNVLLHNLVVGSTENLELNIGIEPITLEVMLRQIETMAARPRRNMLKIPLLPLKVVASTAGALGISLPINIDNLRGLETVEAMETASSLRKLGMQLRPFGDLEPPIIKDDFGVDPRIKVLLVGAGKVGIVHGVNLLHRGDVKLAGIVDPVRKAWKLYQGIGFEVPFFCTLDEALKRVPATAAIVAAPADKHLAIAEECLRCGLRVLTEKPTSVTSNQLDIWRSVLQRNPEGRLHVGYMAAQLLHVGLAKDVIESGKLGRIRGVSVVAVQTHIMSSKPLRWEMLKARSGGGVLINFGCHALSVLNRLFGLPKMAVGHQWGIFSEEVEDAVAAKLSYGSFGCEFLTCWSLPGYGRPVLWVEVQGEHGTMTLDYFGLSLSEQGKSRWLGGQPDADLTFNFCPDYTGGGFWQEHDGFFRDLNDNRDERAVRLEEAAVLEEWIFKYYDHSNKSAPTNIDFQDERLSRLLGQMMAPNQQDEAK